MSIRLYVGNLPKEVEKQELQAVFEEYGDAASAKIITDRKTGKCRGFGFVTVKDDETADQIIEKFNGYSFKESTLKIEKALPRAKGKEEGAEAAAATGTGAGTPTRRNSNKGGGGKPRRSSDSSSSSSDSVQPDPRWAKELEKLKDLLATQTANS
jgi:RNA recognition motif-containing protein